MPTPPTKIDHITDDLHQYFWSKVDGTLGLFDCWIWKGSTYKNSGYGFMLLDGHRAGAHRVSWFIHNGQIPDGMEIMHDCDNPRCVNPIHLKPGTHLENMQDRDRKHRRKPPVGEKSNLSKLNDEKVTEIRRLRKTGMTMRQIAKIFDVTSVCVVLICTRENWAHLPDPE